MAFEPGFDVIIQGNRGSKKLAYLEEESEEFDANERKDYVEEKKKPKENGKQGKQRLSCISHY